MNMRRYLSEVEAFGERERVKTIKKKGYFKSADELLSLRDNLSLFFRINYRKSIFTKEIFRANIYV